METNYPQTGEVWQIIKVLTPKRCPGRSKASRTSHVMASISGYQADGTEDVRKQRLRPLKRITARQEPHHPTRGSLGGTFRPQIDDTLWVTRPGAFLLGY